MDNIIASLLTVLSLTLAATIAAEYRLATGKPAEFATEPTNTTETPISLSVSPFSLPALDAFSETVERPLFAKTRRPQSPQVMEAKQPEQRERLRQASGLLLSGIVIVDDARFVLMYNPEEAKTTRLEQGEAIAGWRLEEVFADRVALRNGEATEELELRRFEPPPLDNIAGTEPTGETIGTDRPLAILELDQQFGEEFEEFDAGDDEL